LRKFPCENENANQTTSIKRGTYGKDLSNCLYPTAAVEYNNREKRSHDYPSNKPE
jgi:hypothetical protein